MTPLPVAAAWLRDDRDRILLCRRLPDKARGGLWEFPGGKLEKGETPGEAIARELEEELGLTVSAGDELARVSHDYGDISIELILIEACKPRGDMKLADHSEIRWCRPEEIGELDLAPADRELIDKQLYQSYT